MGLWFKVKAVCVIAVANNGIDGARIALQNVLPSLLPQSDELSLSAAQDHWRSGPSDATSINKPPPNQQAARSDAEDRSKDSGVSLILTDLVIPASALGGRLDFMPAEEGRKPDEPAAVSNPGELPNGTALPLTTTALFTTLTDSSTTTTTRLFGQAAYEMFGHTLLPFWVTPESMWRSVNRLIENVSGLASGFTLGKLGYIAWDCLVIAVTAPFLLLNHFAAAIIVQPAPYSILACMLCVCGFACW